MHFSKRVSHIFQLFKFAAFAAAGAVTLGYAADAEGVKFFEQKVRPILAAQCVECHGAGKAKGKLRLDTLEAALKGGSTSPAIVPNEPEKSLLIAAIEHTDPDLTMPPKKPKLPDSDRAALAQWIRIGAPWPDGAVIA